ncbi:Uncharacterized protein DAT39_003641, partial [Clarias magur]
MEYRANCLPPQVYERNQLGSHACVDIRAAQLICVSEQVGGGEKKENPQTMSSDSPAVFGLAADRTPSRWLGTGTLCKASDISIKVMDSPIK